MRMQKFLRVFFVEVLICLSACCFSVTNATAIKTYKKTWSFKEDRDFIANHPISIGKNNQFAYIPWKPDRQERKNLVATLEHFHADGIIYKDRCATHVPYVMIRSSFKDRVIYAFRQDLREDMSTKGYSFSGYVLYRQVNMINCSYKDTKFFVNTTFGSTPEGQASLLAMTKPLILQYHDGSYEVFTYDNYTCDAARCKQFVSAVGELSDKAIPYLPKEYALDQITMYPTSVKDTYYALVRKYPNYDFTKKTKEVKLMYAQPGGEADELINFDDKDRIIDVDATDGYLTICWTSNSSTNNYVTTVECNQYNSQKDRVFSRKIELPYDIRILKVKCLSAKAFLLLTEECNDNDCIKGSHYYVRKIQPDGNDSRTMEVDGFDPVDVLFPDIDKYPVVMTGTNISVDDDRNICISVAVKRSGGHGIKWTLVWKCFPGKYLDVIN